MGTVLKQHAPLPPARIPAAVVDATARASALVAAAEEDAERIRGGVAAERARALEEAEAAGFEAGRGRAAAVVIAAAEERDRLLASAARDVAALAIDVARRVLGRELATDPGAVVDLAAHALAGARERTTVALRVSPTDAPRVRAAEERLGALLARAHGVAVRADAGLAPGDVIVETEAGRIDARFEAQLAALERALAEVGA